MLTHLITSPMVTLPLPLQSPVHVVTMICPSAPPTFGGSLPWGSEATAAFDTVHVPVLTFSPTLNVHA